MTIDDILESFEFLDSWEERYGFIIDLGRELPAMDDALKTDTSKVEGCMSQVWLVSKTLPDSAALGFVADSDALIVKGLIAVLLAVFNKKTPEEILAIDVDGIFDKLGFHQAISVNRRNGFFAMVERIKGLARHYSA